MDLKSKLSIINAVLNKDNEIFINQDYLEEDVLEVRSEKTSGLSKKNNENLYKTICCFSENYLKSINGVFSDNEIINKEFNFIMNTQHCIYISILLKKIIEKLTDDKVEFNIGFYEYEDENPFSLWVFQSKDNLVLHSWITINGIVVDLTLVPQIETFVQIENFNKMIIGDFPGKLKVSKLNKERNKELENKCFFNILKHLGLSEEEWINIHLNEINKN